MEDVSVKSPFEDFDTTPCSIEERFPNETGSRLQEAVWRRYCIEDGTSSKLYLKDSTRAFLRHKVNDRDEHDSRAHYTQLILRHGFLRGVRGPPWATAEKIKLQDGDDSESEGVRYHLISSATLMEAAYIAAETCPENSQVRLMLNTPIKNITIFHPRTPIDVLQYLKELANLLNGTGSKASFVERMRLIPTIEARWATERTQQNLKCRDAGYNGKLAEFLSKFFPQKFDSARDYAKASSVYNLLVTQKLWPSLERYLNQHVVFSTPNLNPHDVYQSFAVVCKALLHQSAPQSWKQVALCAFRFCVPTDDGVPWVFRGEETMDKFYQLLAPMADSAACKVKTSGKSTKTEEDPSENHATKRKRAGKAKAKAKAKAGDEFEGQQKERACDPTMPDGRATLLIDDLVNAVEYVLQDVAERDHSAHAIEAAFITALKFVFVGSIEANGKPLKVWTKARLWIKQELVRRHSLKMRVSDPDARLALTAAGAEAGADELVSDDSSQVLELLQSNPKLGQKVAAFAAENTLVECDLQSDTVLTEHLALARVQVNFRKKIKELVHDVSCNEKLNNIDAIVSQAVCELHACLGKEFEDDIMALAKFILVSACKMETKGVLEDEAAFQASAKVQIKSLSVESVVGVPAAASSTGPLKALASVYSAWPTVGHVRNFVALRSCYAVAALRSVSAAWQQVPADAVDFGTAQRLLSQTQKDVDSAIHFISRICGQSAYHEMVGMDVSASDWPATWCKLLAGARSISKPNFTARTPSQWDTFKAEQVAKLKNKRLDELRKLARPFLKPPAAKDVEKDRKAVGDGEAKELVDSSEHQQVAEAAQEDAAAQVDAQLAPMNKSQLADLIADELVAEAKAEEATLVQKWSSLVADVAVCAKLSPQDSVDDAGLASAIASAVGATLAPDTEMNLKDLRANASTASLWATFKQGTALEWIACHHSELSGSKCDCGKVAFQDEGSEHIVVKIGGKPGNLKAKLFYRKPVDGQPVPDKIRFYFMGKVTVVSWTAAVSGGGSKQRILLKNGSDDECKNDSQKFALVLSPLPVMTNLQSPMWKPAWNVKTVPTTEKKLGKDGKEKPEVLPTMTCVKQHVSIQCGHLRYEGEVAYLEFDPRNHAGEGDVELTRYPFPEELWKKARDSRSSAQGVESQLLMDEDDCSPLDPEALAADVAKQLPVKVKLFRHLLR